MKMKKKKKKSKVNVFDKNRKSKKVTWLTVQQVEVVAKGGYFDSEGVLHNGEGCPRCTSVISSIGKRCKNFAVPGELHCRIHGGVKGRTKMGKLRIYSAFIQDPTLAQVYENMANNEEVQGVREELGLLRILLAKIVKEGIEDVDELKSVASTIGEIRKLIDSCMKAEIQLGRLIDVNRVMLIVKALAEVVAKHVKDKEVIERIAQEFDRIIWPAPLASTPQPTRRTPSREVPALPG